MVILPPKVKDYHPHRGTQASNSEKFCTYQAYVGNKMFTIQEMVPMNSFWRSRDHPHTGIEVEGSGKHGAVQLGLNYGYMEKVRKKLRGTPISLVQTALKIIPYRHAARFLGTDLNVRSLHSKSIQLQGHVLDPIIPTQSSKAASVKYRRPRD